MKILIGVHHFPPHYTGGAEWHSHRLASTLQRLGHEARVIAVENIDRGPESHVEVVNENFDGVEIQRLSFNLNAAPDPFIWEYHNPWIGEHFRQEFERYQPDLFHLIGGYMLTGSVIEAAQQAGIPTVVSLTDFWWLCYEITMMRPTGELSTAPVNPADCVQCMAEQSRRYRLLGKIAPEMMKKYWSQQENAVFRFARRNKYLLDTINLTDRIISPSQALKDMYELAGVKPGKITVIRHGRNLPDQNRTLRLTPKRVQIGYIGQIINHKGVHLLLEAIKKLPKAEVDLHIYGDMTKFPEYADQLLRQAKGDSRIHFQKVFLSNELTRVMDSLDVVVVPSTWYENCPNVILEAFAHKTPVIATNLGGMAELVKHNQSGLLFKMGDSDDLARQIQALLDDPDLLNRLSAGIPRVMSVDEEIEEFIKEYHHTLERYQVPVSM